MNNQFSLERLQSAAARVQLLAAMDELPPHQFALIAAWMHGETDSVVLAGLTGLHVADMETSLREASRVLRDRLGLPTAETPFPSTPGERAIAALYASDPDETDAWECVAAAANGPHQPSVAKRDEIAWLTPTEWLGLSVVAAACSFLILLQPCYYVMLLTC